MHHPNDDGDIRERDTVSHVDVALAEKEFQHLNQMLHTEEREQDVESNNGIDLQDYLEGKDSSKEDARKKMGITFKDLTVKGVAPDSKTIPTILELPILIGKLFWPPAWKKKERYFDILHTVSGLCKAGEMLLVLGRPGSGCSTFLRVLANRTNGYHEILGEVKYGGVSAKEFSRYTGEAIYTAEEDMHYPSITLKDTLTFALRTKTPGNKIEETKRHFRQNVFTSLVSMFGLSNQKRTLVGNEWIRGLSGGERKRLTISEAMVSSSAIECWDCSSRGLDSASALDYVKSLRVRSNTVNKTTIATLYQLSEEMYNLFDRVMVLDKGKCIYFGPTTEAKQYFVELGFVCGNRKNTPDFITGVTNKQEREIRPGFENTAPLTPTEFEQRYQNSSAYSQTIEDIKEYEEQIEREVPYSEFKKSVRETKNKGVRKTSKYTASMWVQLHALFVRQLLIIKGSKFDLASRYISTLIQSIIYGSVFLLMPLSVNGAYTRGGAIVSSILFNALLNSNEMPACFVGRNITAKHKSYAIFHLAQAIMDIPLTFLQTLLYTIITYFMYGLDSDAGKFFAHMWILFFLSCAITELFRLLGNLNPTIFLAHQFFGVMLIIMFSMCGFWIPYQKMHPWFKWIFWANPFAYAYKALFINEMRGLTFDCVSDGYYPSGDSYNNSAYRVCAIAGAEPGSTTVSADVYLPSAYGFYVSELTIDIIAVALFWILNIVLNCIAVEFVEWSNGGYTQKVYKEGHAPKMDSETEIQPVQSSSDQDFKFDHGGVLLWDDIKYTVKVKEGERLLLDNVKGWIKPGNMTALMGSSGAGKTTLLDVLAQRKTQGRVEGTQLLNAKPLGVDFERITGYIEQMDVHNPFLTVRESLRFSARLRQDASIPLQEKYDYVEKVLEIMDMKDLAEALVGDLESGSGIGISVEERKRLTIGMELVAKPNILFLDEPTSGLDSQSSYNIVKFIRKLADAGMPLVCTIHQPSATLFEYFDNLLLLARGGKTVYFGEIGENSSVVTSYFNKHGSRECTANENPAEYILEVIGAGVHGLNEKNKRDWVQTWKDSEESRQVQVELDQLKQNKEDHHSNGKATMFASSVTTQLWVVLQYVMLCYYRNPNYNAGRLVQSVVIALIIGFTFYQLEDSTSDMNIRILALFQMGLLGIVLIVAACPPFFLMRDLFKRHYASRYYSFFPFSVAITITELPLFLSTLMFVCAYWTIGFSDGVPNGQRVYFWFMLTLLYFYAVSVGQMISSATPSMPVTMSIFPIFSSMLVLFCGVLSPPSSLPHFWESWMYWLDPFHYFFEGTVTSLLNEVIINCTSSDLYRFAHPPNTTCESYLSDYFAAGNTGYLAGTDANDMCEYCLYKSGREYFSSQIGWSADNQGRDAGVYLCFWIFNVLLAAVFVFFFRRQSR